MTDNETPILTYADSTHFIADVPGRDLFASDFDADGKLDIDGKFVGHTVEQLTATGIYKLANQTSGGIPVYVAPQPQQSAFTVAAPYIPTRATTGPLAPVEPDAPEAQAEDKPATDHVEEAANG